MTHEQLSVIQRISSSIRFKWKGLLIFFSLLGPGLITAFADNDAGGVSTYSVAGATFGYNVLWALIPITIMLIVVQEMSARMGIVTGKGLADLIRETYGIRLTLFLMSGLFLANLATVIADVAGIAAAGDLLGIARMIIVPISAILLLVFIIKGNYKSTEKFFFFLIIFYLAYVLTGFLAKPDWAVVMKTTFVPKISFTSEYVYILIGLIGTTITPWMQFYLQSEYVEKGTQIKNYKYARSEIVMSSIVSDTISFFMILTCAATLFYAGIRINTAQEAALSLRPLAGNYAYIFFAIGLLGASALGAIIVPISTAFSICEGIGFETGVNKNFKDAPVFYWIIIILVAIGVAIALIPSLPLIKIMVLSQVFAGMVLPIIMISTLKIMNKKEIMGAYVNSKTFNIIAYSTVYLTIGLTICLLVSSIQSIF